jgi:hypothetical protein
MKKTTKPAQQEEATFYSDFSGKCFGEMHPPVELILDFGYGSGYDGSKLTFHLDYKEVEDILFLLKSKLSNETKSLLKQRYTELDSKYEDSVQSRDWTDCNFICNETDLLKKLI